MDIQRFGYNANGVLIPNAKGLWVRMDDEDYGRASEIETALRAISGDTSNG